MHGGGRHRRDDPYHGRHRREEVRSAARAGTTLAVVSIGLGSLVVAGGGEPGQPAMSDAASAVDVQARRHSAASRSLGRPPARPTPGAGAAPTVHGRPSTVAAPRAAATATAKATPTAKATSTAKAASPTAKVTPTTAAPARPAPVGGLSQRQMDHAAVIVREGQRLRMPRRAYVIAVATALQESYLRNLANGSYPESLRRPHDAVGADHDSVGLFQQRPSAGWGTVVQCMTPAYAAARFYQGLAEVPGWQDMSLTEAAQAVQVSAFPYAYARHEPLATRIVDALT